MISEKKCGNCGKLFKFSHTGSVQFKRRRFCNNRCKNEAKKGKGNPMYGKVSNKKDKTYEEIYGKERAIVIRGKMSVSHCGNLGYWKGKKRPSMSRKARKKISRAMTGRKIFWKDKLKGPKSEEHKRKIALAKIGENNPNWHGGNYIDWSKSPRYKRYRKKVFGSKGNICQKCNAVKSLEVHHIQDKKTHPELMFNVGNSAILCNKCHKVFHQRYGQVVTKKELEKFLS